ncbi:retrovirus-related pol polyprotein from transposon TNT 1-94 [Tanacetum coccineum]
MVVCSLRSGLILRGGLFTLPEVRHFVVVCSLRNSLILRDGLFTLPENPPYKFKWTEKTVPVVSGSSETTTEGYMEKYKNSSQDIWDQLNAEVKAVQIILTGIDNDIYSLVDACLNACEISQLAATRNRGKAIFNSPPPTYDQEPTMVAEDDEIRANQDNTPRINKGTGYDNQRAVNVAGARENVGTQMVQQSEIQCYNCKEYGHVARECQKLKRVKVAAYHKEKMLLYMSTNGEMVEQDEDDLAKERDLLASLIDKLKCEIDANKNRNNFLNHQERL